MEGKLKSAIFSTLVFTVCFIIFSFSSGEKSSAFVLVAIYGGIGNLLYGIPVSLLSDFVTKKIEKVRFVVAAILHLVFGMLPVLMIDELAYYSVSCAALFFLADEWQKRQSGVKNHLLIKGVTAIALSVLAFWGVGPLHAALQAKTNTIFLIPEGFEGPVVVQYNMPNQPKLKQEGDFAVVPIQLKTLNAEDVKYGMYKTSSKKAHGVLNNQYYYVDESGNRTAIDENCINRHMDVPPGGANTEEVQYQTIEITHSQCGNPFYYGGSKGNEAIIEEID